jgi:hypothetical protein
LPRPEPQPNTVASEQLLTLVAPTAHAVLLQMHSLLVSLRQQYCHAILHAAAVCVLDADKLHWQREDVSSHPSVEQRQYESAAADGYVWSAQHRPFSWKAMEHVATGVVFGSGHSLARHSQRGMPLPDPSMQ